MTIIYNFLIALYTLVLRIVALFNPKAALWVNGRKDLLQRISIALPPGEKRIWMHCASLGEFEQGRPVLEALRVRYPDYKIVLTFFSPSGYEIRKNYDGADYIFYLPMDGKNAASTFLDAVSPSLVLFVKYEFWYYYLSEIKSRKIPALLISAAFRQDQSFFKWYGSFFRKMLDSFSHILVQDKTSKDLLDGIGLNEKTIIGGDTRYDRVTTIANSARKLPEVETFISNHNVLIAGSTWPADEAILKQALSLLPEDWKLIIAPHEIDDAHLNKLRAQFTDAAFYSDYKTQPESQKKTLVIDNIGMLSSLYQYGDIAFVGGGFNKSGIHNVLESAVFGTPVIIGPIYQKFVEAVQLAETGCVIPVNDAAAFNQVFTRLMSDQYERQAIKVRLHEFMNTHIGATDLIMNMIVL